MVRVCEDVRVLVLVGSGEAIEAERDHAFVEEELVEFVEGFVVHFLGNVDLPEVGLLELDAEMFVNSFLEFWIEGSGATDEDLLQDCDDIWIIDGLCS